MKTIFYTTFLKEDVLFTFCFSAFLLIPTNMWYLISLRLLKTIKLHFIIFLNDVIRFFVPPRVLSQPKTYSYCLLYIMHGHDMVVQILKQIILVSIQNPLKFYTCIIIFFAINMFYYIIQGNCFHSFYKNNLKQVNTHIFQWRSVELDKGHEFIHTSPLYTRGKLTWAKIHLILREKIWFYF